MVWINAAAPLVVSSIPLKQEIVIAGYEEDGRGMADFGYYLMLTE